MLLSHLRISEKGPKLWCQIRREHDDPSLTQELMDGAAMRVFEMRASTTVRSVRITEPIHAQCPLQASPMSITTADFLIFTELWLGVRNSPLRM